MKVEFGVTVGYDYRSVVLTEQEWTEVQEGADLQKSVNDGYDGEEFTYTFNFNGTQKGELLVTYQEVDDDTGMSEGVGFDGPISEGIVTIIKT
jgi:hypothetical protein